MRMSIDLDLSSRSVVANEHNTVVEDRTDLRKPLTTGLSYVRLPDLSAAAQQYARLRNGSLSASQLAESAIANYASRGTHDNAYLTWNGEAALQAAHATDSVLAVGGDTGPLMGIPVSIKDIFAVPGLPTYAGSVRRLPECWEQAGPMIAALLRQLPSVMGKTHTVEFAFGGLGTNPHWGTPRNPWDPVNHRTPGGSSAGAGVSLMGAARVWPWAPIPPARYAFPLP